MRFYLLGTHYRAGLNFAEEDVLSAKKRLDRIYRIKKRIYPIQEADESQCKEFKEAILEALNDDLNISKALSVVDEFINKANEFLDKKQKDKISSIAGFLAILERLLGVGGKNPFEYFQLGVSEEQKQEIENLIAQRTEAKKQKDFAKADEIRERLHSMGIEIMDLPTKSVWEKV